MCVANAMVRAMVFPSVIMFRVKGFPKGIHRSYRQTPVIVYYKEYKSWFIECSLL